MGKIRLFTKEQKIILDEIKNSKYLRSNFYFTGGTALSGFYLSHRYSDDLDFFSEDKFDNQILLTLIEEWGSKCNFSLKARFIEVVYIFNLMFKNKTQLKVDFAYYPHKRLEKGIVVDSLEIDSLLDIAVNKMLTISSRSEVKDFVDLYFLLQKFHVWDLITGVKIKFNIEIEPLLLGSDFLKVEDFDFLPRMILPLTLEELKDFFRQKAKEMGLKSVE
jgi:predicted nucleotidyltransferase component of viral defense system